MNSMHNDMDQFYNQLNLISNYFEKINNSRKEVDFNKINSLISSIELNRLDLKNKYPLKELNIYSDKITFITKQINKNLDNIIASIRVEQMQVSQELNNLHNQKKIVTYNR